MVLIKRLLLLIPVILIVYTYNIDSALAVSASTVTSITHVEPIMGASIVGNMIEKIISALVGLGDLLSSGFKALGNALSEIFGGLFQQLFDVLESAFRKLFEFLGKSLGLLIEFLEGIFYFIAKLFEVVVKVVTLFVMLFQFVASLTGGVVRTLVFWMNPDFSAQEIQFPSDSHQGFMVVMDLVAPTGLLTIVPRIATALLWIAFVLKTLGMIGGQIMVNPLGSGGKK